MLPIHRRFASPLLVAIGMMLAITTSCRSTQRADDQTLGATLVFVNQSLENAEVYAVTRGASQVRLGMVMQGERQTFEIPARLLRQGANLTIVARTSARARSISSGPVTATSGEAVHVTLPLGATHLIIETGRQ